MKKYILFISAIVVLFSCKKEEPTTYPVTLTATGNGTYKYQVGSEIHEDTLISSFSVSRTAKPGDLVLISANGGTAIVDVALTWNQAGEYNSQPLTTDQRGNNPILSKQF